MHILIILIIIFILVFWLLIILLILNLIKFRLIFVELVHYNNLILQLINKYIIYYILLNNILMILTININLFYHFLFVLSSDLHLKLKY